VDEAFIRYAMPALVAGIFGIASALITARISGAAERRRAECEAKAKLDAWDREFSTRYAELQATNRSHAEALRQQFAKAYIRVEELDPKMADRYFIPAYARSPSSHPNGLYRLQRADDADPDEAAPHSPLCRSVIPNP
jgi:hypothetical protein